MTWEGGWTVGQYSAPQGNWKRKRRSRDAKKVPLVPCTWCGGQNKVGRHHSWRGRRDTPPPIVLCRPCHETVDGKRGNVCHGCCVRLESCEEYRVHVGACRKVRREVLV